MCSERKEDKQQDESLVLPSPSPSSSSPPPPVPPLAPGRDISRVDSMEVDEDGESEAENRIPKKKDDRPKTLRSPPKPPLTQYPRPLNHNDKPILLIKQQTFIPSKVNYVGGNLTAHNLVRCLVPKKMPSVCDLVISVLVFSVNRRGRFKVFLQRGTSAVAQNQPYDVVVPEVTVPIMTDRDDRRQFEGFGAAMTTIGHVAYQQTRVSGADKVTEMDCLLLPGTFGEKKMRLRVVAMFKCVDEEGELKIQPGGGWLTEEDARNKKYTLGGGLVMKREINRGFKMLEAAAKDPTREVVCPEPPAAHVLLQQLLKDARNEQWKPAFGPIRYLPETYCSLNEFF